MASGLTGSQRVGAVTLKPKGGDRMDMGNWRPISLLNTDYKWIAKIITNRLKPILARFLNRFQVGAIPGGQSIWICWRRGMFYSTQTKKCRGDPDPRLCKGLWQGRQKCPVHDPREVRLQYRLREDRQKSMRVSNPKSLLMVCWVTASRWQEAWSRAARWQPWPAARQRGRSCRIQ